MSNKRLKKKPKKSSKSHTKDVKKAAEGLNSLSAYLSQNPAHHYLVEFKRENTDHVLGFAIAMNPEEVNYHMSKILREVSGKVDISTLPRDLEDYSADVEKLEAGYSQHKRLYASH